MTAEQRPMTPVTSALAAINRAFAILQAEPQATSPAADAVIAGGGNQAVIVANLQQAHGGRPTDFLTDITEAVAAIRQGLGGIEYLQRHTDIRFVIDQRLDGCLSKAASGDRVGAAMCLAQAVANIGHVTLVTLVEYARTFDPHIPPATSLAEPPQH